MKNFYLKYYKKIFENIYTDDETDILKSLKKIQRFESSLFLYIIFSVFILIILFLNTVLQTGFIKEIFAYLIVFSPIFLMLTYIALYIIVKKIIKIEKRKVNILIHKYKRKNKIKRMDYFNAIYMISSLIDQRIKEKKINLSIINEFISVYIKKDKEHLFSNKIDIYFKENNIEKKENISHENFIVLVKNVFNIDDINNFEKYKNRFILRK